MTFTVLITGANRGIGLEFAEQYAQKGWQVLACCRQPERAKALSELAKVYANVQILPLDVTNETAVTHLASQLQYQSIDVLLNNAGVSLDEEPFGSTDAQAWLSVLKVNALAPLLVTQAFIEHVTRSSKKIIAMMSSKMGSIADNQYGMYYAYRASKAALNAQVSSLAIDLKERGITVMSLHPGWVQTDMGGPDALISARDSVAGLLNIIDNATLKDSGSFRGYDGEHIPW